MAVSPSLDSPLRLAGDVAVPLTAVRLGGRIVGRWAELRLEQDFAPAPHGVALEARYVFPLPVGAVVTDFSFTVADRVTRGRVERREDAAETYREAVRAGRRAALVEEVRGEVFSLLLGNLDQNAPTRVELVLLVPLEPREGCLRWRIPTVVAPRFAGNGAGAGQIAPGHAGEAPYRLTLDLEVPWTAGLEVDSPSHDLLIRRDGEVVRIGFDGPGEPLDRDLVLEMRAPDEAVMAWAQAEQTAGQGVVSLFVVPDLANLDPGAAERPLEVVFLVDRSGSMGGASMEEARRALRLCLRQLRPGDRFGILAFDDALETFSRELETFGQGTLERADQWIATLDARGGTDLQRALEAAYRLAPDAIHVLLTDAQVWGEDALTGLVDKQRAKGAKARLHAFGIGTNVVMGLLQRMARATAGDAVDIVPGEAIDDKVAAQFAAIMAPRLEEVAFTLEGAKLVETLPAVLPPLIDGQPFQVLARFKGKGPVTLHLKASGAAGTLEKAYPLAMGDESMHERPDLTRLWARERVLDALRQEPRDEERKRWAEFAVTHQVMTPLTSWVAVDTKGRKVKGRPVTVEVPRHAPAGWEGDSSDPPLTYSAGGPELDADADGFSMGGIVSRVFSSASENPVGHFFRDLLSPADFFVAAEPSPEESVSPRESRMSGRPVAASAPTGAWRDLLLDQEADGQWAGGRRTLAVLVDLAPWFEAEAQVRAACRRAMPGLLDQVAAGLDPALTRLVLALARALGLERRRVDALVARLLPAGQQQGLVRQVLAASANPVVAALATVTPGKKDLVGDHLAAPLLSEIRPLLPNA
ncbi:MAG: VIT domain-containing protein [Candidatus Sericytochromatia bacterium]|nr:VIT domain-containing protein [Candidatus Sericytochromatia bacterium]